MTTGQLNLNATARMDQMLAELDRAEQKTKAFANAQGISTSKARKVERALNRQDAQMMKSNRTTGLLTQAMGRLSPAAASATQSLQGMAGAGSALGAAALPVGVFVAAVVALGAAAFATASKMSQIVDDSNNLAEASGLSVETTIALKEALAAKGKTIQQVSGGLSEFTRKVADAAVKGGEGAAQFDKWGLSYKNLDGSIRDANLVFRDALQIIDQQANATDRASARLQIFGNEAGRALAALDPATLREAERNTQGLAAAIADAGEESAEWDRAFAQLQTSTDRLMVSLGSEFAGDIATIVDGIADAVEVTANWSGELADLARFFVPGGRLAHMLSDENISSWTDWASGVDQATASTRALKEQFEEFRSLRDMGAMDQGPQMPDDVADSRAKASAKAAEERAKEQAANAKKWATEQAKQRATEKKAQQEQASWEYGLWREFEDGQAEQIKAGQRMAEEAAKADQQAAQAAQDATATRIAAMDAERAAQEALNLARIDGAMGMIAASGALAQVMTKNAKTQATAALLETIAYQSVAVGRAFAEGGPWAGPGLALSSLAMIIPQIAALKAASQQSHMGSQPLQGNGAPDETTVRVRNGQRISNETDDRRQGSGAQSISLVIDNQVMQAATKMSSRQSAIYTGRRRKSVAVGRG